MPAKKSLSIFIIEAIDLSGKSIEEMVKGIGHEVVGSAEKPNLAYSQLANLNVDLVLFEINHDQSIESIKLANQIKENLGIPLIYLTNIDDYVVMEQLISTDPYGYLMCPYSKSALQATIRIAYTKFKKLNQVLTNETSKVNYIYVNEGALKKKLPFDQILFIESDGNYIEFHTTNKVYRERTKLKDIVDKVTIHSFFKVNKGLLLNLSKATGYNLTHVFLGDIGFPISRSHKRNIKEYFKAKQ